jgi:hypothetical protein
MIAPRPPSQKPPQQNANQQAPPPQQHPQYKPPTPPSIFASNKSVPALGGVWSPFLDLHLLVGWMPRRKGDARVVYGEAGRERRGVRAVEMVGVVEVVADRYRVRGGGWGTFVEGENGVVDV